MNFFQAAILGLVQGLTEFIPVSSTGHLIVVRELLGLDTVGTISFDAILQLATAVALICYFWRDIWNVIQSIFDKEKSRTLLWALVIGTIPAIVAGLLLEKYMDTIFRGTHVVAVTLIVGSVVFYFAEKFAKNHHPVIGMTPLLDQGGERGNVSLKQGLFIGLFQCLALIPGFSRSGATISGGLFNRLNREVAARFSFLLSIPIILGSGLKKVFDIYQTPDFAALETSLIIACIFAFISGLLAIHFLLKFLKNHSLNYFGVYRIILAVVILIWL
jgi:undecaprenyl-diphosphatase